MRACGDVPDGMRHILRLYRSVEQFCPVCAFEACGGGRDYNIRTYAIVELGSILESGHVILGCLHMPLRPTIDWYRWICLICSSRKVGLTPHMVSTAMRLLCSCQLCFTRALRVETGPVQSLSPHNRTV